MYTYTQAWYMGGVGAFIGSFLLCSVLTPIAHAAYISDEQVEAQQQNVSEQLVITLEEHVKLLQMLVIQKLEARVAFLQTLVADE